jgi:hypothetical protein
MTPFYLYTNGALKLVDREEPGDVFKGGAGGFGYMYMAKEKEKWESYISTLPSIEVGMNLKAIWKEGDKPIEGKDFTLEHWTGSAWWPNIHLVDGKVKPGTKQRAIPPSDTLIAEIKKNCIFYNERYDNKCDKDDCTCEIFGGVSKESQQEDLWNEIIYRISGGVNLEVQDKEDIQWLKSKYIITRK